MNIGEEWQVAVQRSAKLGTLISGIFESDKPTETEEAARPSNEPNDVVVHSAEQTTKDAAQPSMANDTVPDGRVSDGRVSDGRVSDGTVSDDVHLNDVDTDSSVETDESSRADSDDGEHADTGAANTDAANEEVTLIESAKEDPAAFGALYERYVDRVYAYIYHRVGNTQEAEDLTARTFYRALSRLHTYEDRGYPFSAWLFRIAHNLVANWHRDRSRRRFLSLDRIWSHSHDGDTPEHAVEQAERSSALWDAINRLPKDRRELIFYKFGSRLSNVEIGEVMNKSESAIKSLYFRTLAALRSDLEKDDL